MHAYGRRAALHHGTLQGDVVKVATLGYFDSHAQEAAKLPRTQTSGEGVDHNFIGM